MQWDTRPTAGFSSASTEQLYLPVETGPDRTNVAVQRSNSHSVLNHVRQLIALRQAHPALCASASFEPVYAEAGKIPFVFMRQAGDEKILVALNPANRPCEVTLDLPFSRQPLENLYGEPDAFQQKGALWQLCLPGQSGAVYGVQ
jgi:maltose alpha-D-glucosyltransferase/alpha-amylase